MDYHRFVVMELAGAGYGSPGVLMNERVDLVMDAFDYMKFSVTYENQAFLMRDKK